MKILAIDTSTPYLCLGIYSEKKIYACNLWVGKKLSLLLNLTIKRALDAAGLKANEIDYFACGLGPGSFTGIRIGVATIKGMSWALKKPLIGISSLDILARNAPASSSFVAPIIDAKRDLIYCSIYKTKEGGLRRITPYMLLSIADFLKKMINLKYNTLNIKQIQILGDAVDLYRDKILLAIKGASVLGKDYWYPKAHHLIGLALERIKRKQTEDAFSVKPIYLYPKECQVRNRGTTRNCTRN